MRKISVSIAALLLAVTIVFGASHFVRAENGDNGGGNGSSGGPNSGGGNASEQQQKQDEQAREAAKKAQEQANEAAQKAAEQAREAAKTRAEQQHSSEVETQHSEIENEGNSLLSDLRKKNGEHSQDVRTANCEERKQELIAKLKNLQNNASAFQAKITGVYEAAQAYLSSHNISGTNFDQLLMQADTAQAASKVSVDALSGLSVTIDCSTSTVAEQIATFRVAAEKARNSLRDYKTQVQALLKAIQEQTGGQQ